MNDDYAAYVGEEVYAMKLAARQMQTPPLELEGGRRATFEELNTVELEDGTEIYL